MILLRRDCLVFKTSDGQAVPCPAHEVVLELIGESVPLLSEELLHDATAAVLHYFRRELGQTIVSVGEFSVALEQALRGLGFDVQTTPGEASDPRPKHIAEADLRLIAGRPDDSVELLFFPRLRAEFHRLLGPGPRVVRFRGLQGCVRKLSGARRWNQRCRELHESIVEYLRECLGSERTAAEFTLVVE